MNIADLMIDPIRRSASDVFSTMLGVELPPGEAGAEHDTEDASSGVVSLIGLAGAWAGTGSIVCSAALACRICSLMLMADFPAVNEDVLDAVAELTNIIIGGVKNKLEPQLGPLGLSIPTVVFGKNFGTRGAAKTEWTVVRFAWDGEVLKVRLFLAPVERMVHPHPQGTTAGWNFEDTGESNGLNDAICQRTGCPWRRGSDGSPGGKISYVSTGE
jgi:chemotaxis protein CheX